MEDPGGALEAVQELAENVIAKTQTRLEFSTTAKKYLSRL
jgi:hypothetical protein